MDRPLFTPAWAALYERQHHGPGTHCPSSMHEQAEARGLQVVDGKTSCDCLLASFAQCALANTQLARMRRQPRSLLKGQKPQAIKAARKLAVDWVVKNAAASIYEGFSVGDLVRLVSSETVSACFSWIRNVSANVFHGHYVGSFGACVHYVGSRKP